MSEVLWQPSPDQIERSILHRYLQWLPDSFPTYEDLRVWSITDRAAFWQSVWDFCGVVASQTAAQAIGREAMPGTEWFPGAHLNFAENLLQHRGPEPAIIAVAEGRATEVISRDLLAARTAAAQRGLRSLGVAAGDRVAALIPNCPEAIVGMLATSAQGAVWSSCSPDFGAMGVVDRFGQIEPKVLITADGYRYNGRVFPLQDTVRRVAAELPGLEHIVVIDFAGIGLEVPGTTTLSWGELERDGADEPEFAQLPFAHPLYIVYSSGTTGPPKSMVHSGGGTLIKHLYEHQLHCDIHPGDRVFWFTTCGWMMWNWLVGSLASGATTVLFDGSPTHPDLSVLWRLAGQTGITHLGSSPRFLAANAAAGIVPGEIADLSALRWLGSTGAPLSPEQYDWAYATVAPDMNLCSFTGGTDLLGLFACSVPTLPVRRGELTARALGMAIEAWDPDGKPVVGAKGELVCTRPFPSMPISFWDDPDGTRYREAYFTRFPGVWAHGDFIEIRPEGGMIVYGRSDTTLNPGGVRIGTAEIYRAIETLPQVEDSIVVGRRTGGDEQVVLFVKPASGVDLDVALIALIKQSIRSRTTPRHVPHHVLEVGDIPYTRSGKKVEGAVRRILEGEPVENREALANPESLDLFPASLPD